MPIVSLKEKYKVLVKPYRKKNKYNLITIFILLLLTTVSTCCLSFEQPYFIGVLLSSKGNVKTTDTIKLFVDQKVKEINQRGGINGTHIEVIYLDDHEDEKQTLLNIKKTINNKRLIAYIGLWNSTRGQAIVDLIGKSGIPYICDFTIDTLFKNYKNIYSMAVGISDESKIVLEFIKSKASRIAFIGRKNDLSTKSTYNSIIEDASKNNFFNIFYEKWFEKNYNFSQEELKEIKNSIYEKDIDFILLSLGTRHNKKLIQSFDNMNIPIFTQLGSLQNLISAENTLQYLGEIYDIGTNGIPNVQNQRLVKLSHKLKDKSFNTMDSSLVDGFGGKYADAIGLICYPIIKSKTDSITSLRYSILEYIETLVAGKDLYRGLSKNWSFTPVRTISEDTIIINKLNNQFNSLILNPTQYRITHGQLFEIPVYYILIDLIEISNIDHDEKTFLADFYLTITSDTNIDMSEIEFANSYKQYNKSLLNISLISDSNQNTPLDSKKSKVEIYKISGKFHFNPDLRKFPFDKQAFFISLQPSTVSTSFWVQPPPSSSMDDMFETNGWRLVDRYVGIDADIITSANNYATTKEVIPYYRFNYTWILKRGKVDFLLKVAIPLLILLMVTYGSVFVPIEYFESAITISMTSLLACIALYFWTCAENIIIRNSMLRRVF